MNYSIENEKLTVALSDTGAELQSIRSKITGVEYIWQGDRTIWSGRSPLLFPIVGKLKDDIYIWKGREYTMPKHGFAVETVFSVIDMSSNRISLRCDGREHYDSYPFDFELYVSYGLTDCSLSMKYLVKNVGTDEMFFSIGVHPGFNCAMGDYLEFPDDETACAHRLIGLQKLLSKDKVTCVVKDHRLTVTPDVFKDDALIFDDLRSRRVRLYHDGRAHIEVDYANAPCLGIWAKPGAPYVCIEPWYGIDDQYDSKGRIEDKPRIVHLNAGENFSFDVTVTVLE